MRQLRILKQGVWYEIRTRVNNREPIFSRHKALALFAKVFRETKLRFVFEIRGLCLADDWLTFYIKPADGLELPAIMQWLKQVFAQRYNWAEGRIGHIWGDRYGSWILEGEPPEEEEAGAGRGDSDNGVRPWYRDADTGVRPRHGKTAIQTVFPLIFPHPPVPAPG
ncbi:MAG: transposase [Spirochaetaceae bacterium]|jgi:REP element-mobilizing transposase RayT|nr:transposase [Spirochaetaceae bacterium]